MREGIEEKGIKGVVQGRTKKYESLKEKLEYLRDLEEDPKYKNPEDYDWLKKNWQIWKTTPTRTPRSMNFGRKS